MTARQARIDLNPELTEITLKPTEWVLSMQPQIISVEYEVDRVLIQLGGVAASIGGVASVDGLTGVVVLPLASSLTSGKMSATDKVKLDGIAAGATAYTDELAQDAIGDSLVATTSITPQYFDSGNYFSWVANFGTTAGTVCEGNDSRLSDARTPTAHNQAWSTITATPTTLSGYGITDATFNARAALSAGTGISYDNGTGVITNSAPDQTVSLTAGTGIGISGTYPSFTVASTITQYTDALARSALSLTTTGSSGAATYSSSTGAFNIPQYTLAGLGGIGLASLSASTPLSYNSGTGAFSIQQANGGQSGFLSSTDWTTFNGKQAALGYTPLNAASNLSDLGSASTARTNLGLGTLATVSPAGTPDGTKFLRDDGSWQAASGGTPGGLTTQVQYNNAGAFAGSSNLTFDGTVTTANGLNVTNTIHRLKSVPNIGYRERTTPTATTTRISIYADDTKAVEWYRTVLTVDGNGDLTTKVETDYTRSPNVTRTTTYSRDIYGDLANWEVA